jgi:Mg-chelatase subunit ChlD
VSDSTGRQKMVDTVRSHWPGFAGSTRLIGPGHIKLGFDSTKRVRLLLAVDISGSMRGEGIAFVRSALRQFLRALPATAVDVALVPFDSRGVAPRFSGAKFTSPAGALTQLEALPAPDKGNTALYSAIAFGLHALEVPAAANGASVLVVLTDGVNDVGHGGDDPGLLGGAAGREDARKLIAASKQHVWLVGAGTGVDATELQTLAGKRANATAVAMDPGALVSLLEQIRLSLATQYTLVYGLPASVESRLGRRPLQVTIAGDSALIPRFVPPLLASPLFRGSADTALLSSDLRVIAENTAGRGAEQALAGGALLLVLLAAYAVLWRLASDARLDRAPGAAATVEPVQKAAKRSADESALRRDAVDAPPRSPQDITKDEAA